MTGRTHDLAAFTALSYAVATQALPSEVSLATVIVSLSANFIGGLAPDLDQPTAELWGRIRGGSVLGKLLSPLFGGHRFISHSIVGIVLFGLLAKWVLEITSSVLIVDGVIVWWAFMLGFVSHLVMDTLTRDGVPWLFPIPIRFGVPPFRFLRIKTGGLLEKTFIFPSLIILNIWIYYANYGKFLELLKAALR